MKVIKTQLAFGIAGKAWAAINYLKNEVIELRKLKLVNEELINEIL